jgi:hypothetical protein
MFSSKRRELRVIKSNPVLGIQPPERGTDKSKVYPYPSEFLAVVSCEDVPLDWRELHAVSVYTYARPGELWVLQWPDVDLENEQRAIVRGDDFVKVQRRAGHKLIATTQRYIVEAENRGATFGVPFPPLPASLLGPSSKQSSKGSVGKLHPSAIATDSTVRRRGLEPLSQLRR